MAPPRFDARYRAAASNAAAVGGIRMAPAGLKKIEERIHYRFTDTRLLEEAVRHASFVNESGREDWRDNERLEFLGDAVLNLIVSHLLMQNHPDLREGDLSRMRANLVNDSVLADAARGLALGDFICLGKGEIQTGGQEKNSILADAFEALLAAVYLDGGLDGATEIVRSCLMPLLHPAGSISQQADDKSRLQELVQARQGGVPVYELIREEGPDHDKTFWVRLRAKDILTEGTGKSKKGAEQDAAHKALKILLKM
jgi:ribonuclease III